MLTGSVVGDGNFELLERLFADAVNQTLTFSGTLAQEGAAPCGITYTIKPPAAAQPPAMLEARAALGWTTESLGCADASCSIPALEMHEEPMAAGLDVDESGLLRWLMLSPERPELGRVVCHLDPRNAPPTLVGADEEAFTAGGAPVIHAALVATATGAAPDVPEPTYAAASPPAPRAPPAHAPPAHAPPAANGAAVAPAAPAPSSAGRGAGAKTLAAFKGHVHHPMFGELDAWLGLAALLAAEPEEAGPCRQVAWPPTPTQAEEEEAAQAALPPPSTSWWRGTWRVPEFQVDEEVFVGLHGRAGTRDAAVVLVHPSRSQLKCELAHLEITGPTPAHSRLRGGNQHWTARQKPEWTLSQVAGGAAMMERHRSAGVPVNVD